MYFMQNLLENWILEGNLVKLTKLYVNYAKPQLPETTIFVIIATLLFVSRARQRLCKCAIQSLSADQRGQRQSKNPHNKETKRKKSGKKSCVSSGFISLAYPG